MTVQNRLWRAENQRPFWEGTEPIDVALLADVIVGIVRFAAQEEYLSLINNCLEATRSDAVKLVAIKALVILSQQVYSRYLVLHTD